MKVTNQYTNPLPSTTIRSRLSVDAAAWGGDSGASPVGEIISSLPSGSVSTLSVSASYSFRVEYDGRCFRSMLKMPRTPMMEILTRVYVEDYLSWLLIAVLLWWRALHLVVTKFSLISHWYCHTAPFGLLLKGGVVEKERDRANVICCGLWRPSC